MGKKKGKVYKGLMVVLSLVMVLGLASFAFAEQEWLPGYGDKNGTLGKDGQSWRIGYVNALVGEGTSNGFETFIYYADPTADNVILIPDTSGTLATTAGAASSLTLADTKILIGNSSGLSAPQSVTLTGDVTASTITNAGVIATTIAASAVESSMIATGAVVRSNLLLNTVAVNIAGGDQFTKVEVESGSIPLGWAYISNAGAVNGTTYVNSVEWVDPFLTITLNGTDGTKQTSFVQVFIRP